MARKGFKNDNPLNKMEGKTSIHLTDPDKKKTTPAAGSKQKKTVTGKKKDGTPRKSNAGRKPTKLEPVHTTNIDIPMTYFDKFQKYKLAMGGTMTAYINRLIRDDLEKNEDRYKQITDLMIQ